MTFLSACDMALTRTGKTHRGQKLVFSPTRDTFRCARSWLLLKVIAGRNRGRKRCGHCLGAGFGSWLLLKVTEGRNRSRKRCGHCLRGWHGRQNRCLIFTLPYLGLPLSVEPVLIHPLAASHTMLLLPCGASFPPCCVRELHIPAVLQVAPF